MELRSCGYWHFIQTLNGGLVVKSLNINRGRPTLKFKELKDIYGDGDENNHNPNDGFEGFLSYGKRIAIRPVMSDSDDSEACYSNDDCYDLVSDKITLKQIREKCKAKKRKRPKLVNSWTDEMLISVKEEIKEDDCDLTKPLILWKTKASKEVKAKTTSMKKCVSMSRQSILSSIVKVETIPSDLDFAMSTESLLSIIKVKEEASEITSSDSLNPIGKSSLICDDQAQVDSCEDGHKAIEAAKICTELGMENQASVSDNKNKPLGEVHMTDAESGSSLISEDQPNSNTEALIAPTEEPHLSVISEMRNEAKIATDFLPETEEKLASRVQENPICVLNEICHDYMEQQASPEPGPGLTTADLEVKEDDVADIKDDRHSDFSQQESGGKIDFTDCNCGTTTDDFRCEPKVQSLESDLGSDSCAEEDLVCSEEYSSAANCNFIPSPEDSPLTETNQSQICSSSAVTEDRLAQILDSHACEELNTCPPQRLLSTRKAISPDSQEKLCKAMESINTAKLFCFHAISLDSQEIHNEEHYGLSKKPCSGPRDGNEIEVNKLDKTSLITKIKFSVPQKQNSLKPKHEKRNNQTNPVSNGSHSSPSQKVPQFTSGCNSIESCSQSAIAFSQRQMQDIECLALKLANELKAMKQIAEDRLFSESSISPSLKYKSNEVRAAIKSAAKVEKLANKWLSMMSRDCNRFCKIMTLAEKDSEAPQKDSVANNERKKIIFADEAGEELCRVKFFEKNLTESFETDTEESNEVLT